MSKAFSKQDNGGGAFAEAMHRAVDGERRTKEDRAARYQQSRWTSLPKQALSAVRPERTLRVRLGISAFECESDERRRSSEYGPLWNRVFRLNAYHYSMASLRAKAYAPAGGKSCRSLRLLKPA
jgi:hypothetical protein